MNNIPRMTQHNLTCQSTIRSAWAESMRFHETPASFDRDVTSNFIVLATSYTDLSAIIGGGMYLAAILSVAMMFEHMHLDTAAARIHQAVKDLLASGGPRTPDLGGNGTTETVGITVASKIASS